MVYMPSESTLTVVVAVALICWGPSPVAGTPAPGGTSGPSTTLSPQVQNNDDLKLIIIVVVLGAILISIGIACCCYRKFHGGTAARHTDEERRVYDSYESLMMAGLD
jgi:hypothetical protein